MQLAGATQPKLILPANVDAENAGDVLNIPSLKERQAINAQDPWSSVMHFDVSSRIIFPRIMGVRMCMHCPHCNREGSTSPCQNKFGNNALILGGTAGMCDGFGEAVENQGEGTPHGHGFVALVTPYQHRTLMEIHDLLDTGRLHVSTIKKYSEHLHREEHYDHEAHQRALPYLEKAWQDNYADSSHLGLCAKPSYLGVDDCALAWSRENYVSDNEADHMDFLEHALIDASEFKEKFEKDVQYVFSRVQHHWHQLRDGKRVPLNYCAMKKKGKKHLCKSDFPLTKKCMSRAKVVCPCVAKKHHLKTSGRKNMLGTISGKRRCPWFSGTNSLCAAILRSNTHFLPNFRIPLTEKTTECEGACLNKAGELDRRKYIQMLCLLTQRAMKQMTGYFSGYICKKQKLGNFELKAASSALPFLLQKIKSLGTAAAQLAQVTNRLITTLEGKGILRTAPEAFNLSGKSNNKDELQAEFVRTFRSVNFNGSELLSRLEFVSKRNATHQYVPVTLPPRKHQDLRGYVAVQKDVDIYGFRGNDSRVYYLSAWEFCTHWSGSSFDTVLSPS